MKNFNESQIIGGNLEFPGSKFDNFNLLIDRYYALLFFELLRNGITYSTGRNGILAKVKFENRGFVNYVQPCIGQWDYENTHFQRLVSPDFVIYLFNNLCMAESLYRINKLSNPVDLNEFSVSFVINMHEKYADEYFKLSMGQPNCYDKISESRIAQINLAYSLLEKITKYSKDFAEHQIKVEMAKKIRKDIKNGILTYATLSDKQSELIDNYVDDYESDSVHYLSLGCFNNYIRNKALHQLYIHQGTEYDFNDPIIVYEEFDAESEYDVKINYENAPEFDANKKEKEYSK